MRSRRPLITSRLISSFSPKGTQVDDVLTSGRGETQVLYGRFAELQWPTGYVRFAAVGLARPMSLRVVDRVHVSKFRRVPALMAWTSAVRNPMISFST